MRLLIEWFSRLAVVLVGTGASEDAVSQWKQVAEFDDWITVIESPIWGNHQLGFAGLINGKTFRTTDGGNNSEATISSLPVRGIVWQGRFCPLNDSMNSLLADWIAVESARRR